MDKNVCLVAITSTSPKVGVTASNLAPRKEKMGSWGVSKLFQINLTFLDVRLVIGVSIDIFLVFLFFVCVFCCCCFLVCFFYKNIVTGLNVSEFNQMYEILGWPLSNPIACETHGVSRERQTSRVVCVGL